MIKISTCSILLILVIAITGCNLIAKVPAATPEQPDLQAAVEQTLNFEAAVNAQLTQLAAQAQPPSNTAEPPTVEPTVGPPPTSSVPLISVSMDTNCREGPSAEIWKAIGALKVGQKAEIVAKYDKGHWYIIKNPSNPNERCWVYDFYATIEGDTSMLPKIPVPATPTPKP